MPPVEKVLEMIEKARERTRKAIGLAESLARDTAAVRDAQATKRVLKLNNAIVEVKRHRGTASAHQIRLAQLAFPEQLRVQQAFLAEIELTLARLEAAVVEVRRNAARARDLKLLEDARADARKAIRDTDELVRTSGDLSTLPPAKATKRVRQFRNALVEVVKHHATAFVYVRQLTRQGLIESLGAQRALVAELNAAAARLQVATAGSGLANARDALARMRDLAAAVDARSDDALARNHEEMIRTLDAGMTDAKRCVAATIADEKRFARAAAEDAPSDAPGLSLNPDPETMARALPAQRTAVADLKRQLGDVNDRVEQLKRRVRILVAER